MACMAGRARTERAVTVGASDRMAAVAAAHDRRWTFESPDPHRGPIDRAGVKSLAKSELFGTEVLRAVDRRPRRRRVTTPRELVVFAGVALGAAIGISPVVRRLLQPTLEFIRPLPISALIPVAVAIIGLNAKMVLTVVAFGAMWPVLLATVHGFANIEPRLIEVAGCMAMNRCSFVWKMGLPNAMPDILTGMRLSMTVSLTLAVVGEMITSQEGLGQAMLFAARTFRADDLFASIAMVTLIGSASNGLLGAGERRLLRWQHS